MIWGLGRATGTALVIFGLTCAKAGAVAPGINGPIAFEGSGDRIGIVSGPGGFPDYISPNTFTSADPEVSPDGQRIAFQGTPQGGTTDIYVMDVDGLNTTRLTSSLPSPNYEPTFSPDGQRLAFLSQGKIFAMNADGSGLTRLTSGQRPGFNMTRRTRRTVSALPMTATSRPTARRSGS